MKEIIPKASWVGTFSNPGGPYSALGSKELAAGARVLGVHLDASAAANRLPTIYPWREYVDGGGLLSYGPNLADLSRRAAHYVDRILKGAKPADLPVEQATTVELVVNVKTARALGLAIPPSVLLRAEQVTE